MRDAEMPVYTVERPGGSKDHEFQAYVDLLEEIGIDISNVPRTPEPSASNRWLYVWRDRGQAERFARELRARTREPSWRVHAFEPYVEETGPLAPLVVYSIDRSDGTEFRMDPNSQARVMRHFPNANLAGDVFFSTQTLDEFERQQRPIWDQVIINLLGISQDSIDQLGGIRVVDEVDGETLHERLPEAAA
jgi:hypothetical protein